MSAKKVKNKSARDSTPVDERSEEDVFPIILLKPKLQKGKSVLKALKRRKTIREISDKKLSLQTLSNLLWAASGVNRKKGPFGIPGRTAARARS